MANQKRSESENSKFDFASLGWKIAT